MGVRAPCRPSGGRVPACLSAPTGRRRGRLSPDSAAIRRAGLLSNLTGNGRCGALLGGGSTAQVGDRNVKDAEAAGDLSVGQR
jgi:hypothetical protein